MKRFGFVCAALVLLAGVMVGGCARNTTSNVAELRVTPEGDLDKRIVINHRGFGKKVTFCTLDVRYAGEILQARVEIQNHKKKTIFFAYMFEWTGDDGFPIDIGTSIWKNDQIKGLDQISLIGTAPSTKATNVRLHIREVKN